MTRRIMTAGVVLAMAALAAAADKPAAEEKKVPPAKPAGPVTVAVLDFEGSLPGNADLGTQIADILTARLSIEESFELVERTKLGTIMVEHKLKLAGMVDPEESAKVGKLTGARLLVMGKVFTVDKRLMIVTKVVGVETGRLKGTLREADMNKPLSGTITLLSQDVTEVIKKNAARLLPKDFRMVDPLVKLRKALAGKVLPRVAVVIPEMHRTRVVVDPAVETEIKKTLISCGLTVMDTGSNDLADWAKKMMKSEKQAWPAAMDKADYVVVGQAFSEFAMRTGDLVTCAARAEINVIDRKTGQIVLADRHTARAVDLAEVIAGKTALQKGGRKFAIEILTHFAKTLPDAKAPKPAEKQANDT